MYERGGLILFHLAVDINLLSVHYSVEIFMKSSQVLSNPVKVVRLRRDASVNVLGNASTLGWSPLQIPMVKKSSLVWFNPVKVVRLRREAPHKNSSPL